MPISSDHFFHPLVILFHKTLWLRTFCTEITKLISFRKQSFSEARSLELLRCVMGLKTKVGIHVTSQCLQRTGTSSEQTLFPYLLLPLQPYTVYLQGLTYVLCMANYTRKRLVPVCRKCLLCPSTSYVLNMTCTGNRCSQTKIMGGRIAPLKKYSGICFNR